MSSAKSRASKQFSKPLPIAPTGSVLRPLKAAEIVARDIVHDIMNQGLQPGSMLPSEAAMLKQYGVSRESLREGLRLLEVHGMISIRRGPGGGPIVGTVDAANLGRVEALFFHLAGATYDELFEAWVIAQGTLAERAAANPDAEARKAAMRPYLDSSDLHTGHSDLDQFVRGHGGIHGEVAKLGCNKVLELMLESLGHIVGHHMAMVDDPRPLHESLSDDHQRLAQAVIDGDQATARTIMEGHVEHVVAFARVRMKENLDGYVQWL